MLLPLLAEVPVHPAQWLDGCLQEAIWSVPWQAALVAALSLSGHGPVSSQLVQPGGTGSKLAAEDEKAQQHRCSSPHEALRESPGQAAVWKLAWLPSCQVHIGQSIAGAKQCVLGGPPRWQAGDHNLQSSRWIQEVSWRCRLLEPNSSSPCCCHARHEMWKPHQSSSGASGNVLWKLEVMRTPKILSTAAQPLPLPANGGQDMRRLVAGQIYGVASSSQHCLVCVPCSQPFKGPGLMRLMTLTVVQGCRHTFAALVAKFRRTFGMQMHGIISRLYVNGPMQ